MHRLTIGIILLCGFCPAFSLLPIPVKSSHESRMRPRFATEKDDKGLISGERGKILGALVLIYTSNQWCRSLLFSTVNFDSSDAFRFVNADIGLSESEYALLGTLAFNALFSTASLVAGVAVDSLDAKVLSTLSCAVWSLATIGIGSASTFNQIAALRAVQGLAMAATAPAGYSLLARTYDASRLASANSAYASAVSVGGALASASVLADDRFGWRNTFAGVGGLGVAIAGLSGLLLLGGQSALSKEATTTKGKSDNSKGKKDEIAEGPAFTGAALALLATTATRFCAGFAIAVWAIPVLRTTFPERAGDLGLAYALVVAVCGSSSALLGGQVADAAAKRKDLPYPFNRNSNAARAIVPVAGSLLAAPLWYAALSTESFYAAIVLLGLEFLVAECWIGPATALLANEVRQDQRGKAQGIFTSLTLVGNAAPIGIGAALSSGLVSQPKTILSVVVVAAYLLSTAGFFTVATILRDPVGDSVTKGEEAKSS